MLKDKVNGIPHKPGVYKFTDKNGVVLYVGKAKDLRSRVAQYFGNTDTRAQLPFLLAEAVDIEFTVVNSELESLFLENTLIKEYLPQYNIKLRDDKNYAFIKIDYSTEIPQIGYARKIEENKTPDVLKTKYFGPYSSTAKIRQTLDFVRKIFPYCANKEVGKRPCFYYHLHRCPGVCVGAITLKEYEQQLARIALFLSGKTSEITKELAKEMRSAAKWKHFETAARLRDQLRAIEVLNERQSMLFAKKVSWDFISIYIDSFSACVNLFKVREGKLIDKENFVYDNILYIPEKMREASIMQTFCEMYYATTTSLPNAIYLQSQVKNPDLIHEIISSRKMIGRKVAKIKILVPAKGQKLNLIKLGQTNAQEHLQKWQRTQASNIQANTEALKKLQKILKLPAVPRRIEGYDISNTQGTNPVGSMVVVKDGQPAKSEYRKFKITGKQTPDDFSMMAQMLTRRLSRVNPKNNLEKWPNPDLLVIDGGKGQLSAVVSILKQAKLSIPVIGLAKRIEEIFLPHKSKPIILSHDDPSLQLLQRLRDEAHRFGITFHRSLRSKQAVKSELDSIPGIGHKTKKLLKQKIGTVEKIKNTSTEELASIIGQAKAKLLTDHFKD